MKYETGKDEADPLDLLLRHPLPIIGNNSSKKILKATSETENAVVLDRIEQETRRDTALQKLSTVSFEMPPAFTAFFSNNAFTGW